MKKQITLATALDVKKKLDSLPRIDNAQRIVTTREALQVLKKQISELRNKGYTFVQIAEELSRRMTICQRSANHFRCPSC